MKNLAQLIIQFNNCINSVVILYSCSYHSFCPQVFNYRENIITEYMLKKIKLKKICTAQVKAIINYITYALS